MANYVIGIDEVGRGSLAGPVVVAAVRLPRTMKFPKELGRLRDSKKLTPLQRQRWHAYLNASPRVEFVLARIYPRKIERINVSRAANQAALNAFRRLQIDADVRTKVFLDGGLYLGSKELSLTLQAQTITKGDEKIPAVALASIIAKVTRDRSMIRLAKKHPKYGFELHKGYGTRAHRQAIARLGPSQAHRLTFIGSSLKISEA